GAAGAAGAAGATGGVLGGGITTRTTGIKFIQQGGKVYESGLLEDVHILSDARTASLLVSAPEKTMKLIEILIRQLDQASIARLQDSPESEARQNEVYHVRNSSAVDVANALSTYFGNILTILNEGAQQTPTISLEREVVVVAEPITNKLLINATPRYFGEVMR